jgi:cysteine desulfurase / selenocysteine lyase
LQPNPSAICVGGSSRFSINGFFCIPLEICFFLWIDFVSQHAFFDPELLREDFPILQQPVHGTKKLVYFDNGASTQRPHQVMDVMMDCYAKSYSNVHRGSHSLSLIASDLFEDAREAVRKFINAERSQEIVFTSGTTGSINLVAHSFGEAFLSPGDEILLTEMEHHSNIVPWQQLAKRLDLKLRFLPIDMQGRLKLEALDSFLTERTKLFSFASVSNVLGTRNPVEELTRRAHEVGAKVMVDAAQSVPHEPTDVRHSDVDFLVFSGHKMMGPTGVGVLYGKEALLEEMPPFLGGGSMINTVSQECFTPGELPAKFEAGTPAIVQAIGMVPAIEYLQRVGLQQIFAHEQLLAAKLMDRLGSVDRLTILGPPAEERGGIVSFVIQGVNSMDFSTMVDLKGFAIRNGHHCAMPLHAKFGISESSRASFYLYNTLQEVERFADQVEETIAMLVG